MITADELYKKLLEKKQNEHRNCFDSIDLLPFGNIKNQLIELENEGKIKQDNNIIGSIEVL